VDAVAAQSARQAAHSVRLNVKAHSVSVRDAARPACVAAAVSPREEPVSAAAAVRKEPGQASAKPMESVARPVASGAVVLPASQSGSRRHEGLQ
jgi:hypothetical protein